MPVAPCSVATETGSYRGAPAARRGADAMAERRKASGRPLPSVQSLIAAARVSVWAERGYLLGGRSLDEIAAWLGCGRRLPSRAAVEGGDGGGVSHGTNVK